MPTTIEYVELAEAAENRGDYVLASTYWRWAKESASECDKDAYAAASLRCYKLSRKPPNPMKKITLTITGATVLVTNGVDKVSLHTDLPCQFVPEFLPTQPPLSLDFETTQGMGVEYCLTHFDIEPEVIDVL